ncbi:hypothetical protein AB0Y20_01080 [Heyndrickxia oleronia]|uniref:hypothetical protein n=1 Tax=Heyndrickxia oleronia TaxID=38875 RepID=UPI003F2913C7
MIQPKTLDAINYFLENEIEHYQLELQDDEEMNSELKHYYKGIIEGLKSAKETVNQDWKEQQLLNKLFTVATKLDFAYLEAIQNGGKSSFTGEQYDQLNDVLVEVEEFLGIE